MYCTCSRAGSQAGQSALCKGGGGGWSLGGGGFSSKCVPSWAGENSSQSESTKKVHRIMNGRSLTSFLFASYFEGGNSIF